MEEQPAQRLMGRVVGLMEATHDVRIVRLEIVSGGPLRFRAGQYARLAFGDFPPRDYSMANRPDEEVLEFHIRDMQAGGASAFVASELNPGDEVRIEGAFGEVWLRPDHEGPILAIAGGSGLAPIKSIVETALAAGMSQPIHLYFGVREERDLYLEDHFQGLARHHANLGFVPVLSAPAGQTRRRSGTVADALAEDFDDFASYQAYLAGPPEMVVATVAILERRGMKPDDIHADPFYGEEEKDALGLP